MQVGGDVPLATPHDAQEQVGLTVPSLQVMRPLPEQEFEVPPWEEQQPGQAANTGGKKARARTMAISDFMGPFACSAHVIICSTLPDHCASAPRPHSPIKARLTWTHNRRRSFDNRARHAQPPPRPRQGIATRRRRAA